jgi:hypothetical protein
MSKIEIDYSKYPKRIYVRCLNCESIGLYSLDNIFNKSIYTVECKMCKAIQTFINTVEGYLPMPVFAWDENTPPLSEDMFNEILNRTPENGTILELGSGTTTALFAKQRNIISIEDNEGWIGKFNKLENYIHVPLDLKSNWYNADILKKKINFHYDILIVDGTCFDDRMDKFCENIDLFDRKVPWFLDDIRYLAYEKGFLKLQELRGKKIKVRTDTPKYWGVMEND